MKKGKSICKSEGDAAHGTVTKKNKAMKEAFSPAYRQVKLYSFTLIELLVVIAIITILPVQNF